MFDSRAHQRRRAQGAHIHWMNQAITIDVSRASQINHLKFKWFSSLHRYCIDSMLARGKLQLVFFSSHSKIGRARMEEKKLKKKKIRHFGRGVQCKNHTHYQIRCLRDCRRRRREIHLIYSNRECVKHYRYWPCTARGQFINSRHKCIFFFSFIFFSAPLKFISNYISLFWPNETSN